MGNQNDQTQVSLNQLSRIGLRGGAAYVCPSAADFQPHQHPRKITTEQTVSENSGLIEASNDDKCILYNIIYDIIYSGWWF